MRKPAHTYVVEAIGLDLVKIGCAWDVVDRLYGLKTGSPAPLRLLCFSTVNIERWLHGELAAHRSHGEWFHKTEAVMAKLAEVMEPITETEYIARFERHRERTPMGRPRVTSYKKSTWNAGRPVKYTKSGLVRKKHICSACRGLGHNRRTCPVREPLTLA